MSLAGNLSDRIGGLTELRSLDLSFNPNVTGSLTPRLGDLKNLKILFLAGCGFCGSIPDELGNLAELSSFTLNSNILSGRIPTSLGKLSKLYWLDVAENQLTGTIPISKNSSPGLDQLLNPKQFHFNRNQLSGFIPPELFSSDMMLIHVDLSNNSFYSSESSEWFSTLPSLTTLVIGNGSLQGTITPKVFSFPNIQQVLLRNAFNGTFDLDDSFSPQLQLVDLQNNQISSVTLSDDYKNRLMQASF
ncbi:hypothetical protein NC651_020559 [Populus alba x Populus x berolinensis]|nr:hypothetical protein NC651_020559 [Populus alba x Populus x berolinensis]